MGYGLWVMGYGLWDWKKSNKYTENEYGFIVRPAILWLSYYSSLIRALAGCSLPR
jgi:hypothetical protein